MGEENAVAGRRFIVRHRGTGFEIPRGKIPCAQEIPSPLGEGEDEDFNEANRACDFIIESVFNRRTPIRPGHRLTLRWEGVSIRIRKAVASIENVWDTFCERG